MGLPPTLPVYDAIVLGVGAIGSATLYHLAKRGLNVRPLAAPSARPSPALALLRSYATAHRPAPPHPRSSA